MEEKRQAYLIVAHNNIELLKKLLSGIDNKHFDMYIHIDKKLKNFNEEEIKKVVKFSNIYFLTRKSIGWGAYSQIELTMNLLETANQKYKYEYYHLISGVDFPLKNSEYIYNFFKGKNLEYVSIDNINYEKKYSDRIRYYYFFQESFRNNIISKILNKLIVKVQKILKVDRLKDTTFNIQKGSNWFSITNNFVEYILNQKEFVKKYFKHSFCADELFLQTLLINSPYKYKIYSGGTNGNVRFIDWNRGKPYTFCIDDYNELIKSECMFARKFSEEVDIQIINALYNYIIK